MGAAVAGQGVVALLVVASARIGEAQPSCDNKTGLCLPRPCNASEPPRHGNVGTCTDSLPSGATCRPVCDRNYEVLQEASCVNGSLTKPKCSRSCPAGYSPVEDYCSMCLDGFFKDVPGPWPCQRCPLGANTSKEPRDSSATCICLSTLVANRTNDKHRLLLNCFPCGNNSKPFFTKKEEASLEDCQKPCNLRAKLQALNITGTESYQLQLNSCADPKVNDTAIEWLDGGKDCSLSCKYGTSAQVGTDIFSDAPITFECFNGKFSREPKPMTWCSKASWEWPPLIFLATVTLATALAGIGMEWRQHRFEQRCARALAVRVPKTSMNRQYPEAKCKVA